MTKFIQVITTTARKSDAERIGSIVIKKRLGRCIQIAGPVTSAYPWKGKIEKAKEWVCSIKTEKRLYKKLENAIKKAHSYETPEIIAIPIVAGSKEYLSWLGGKE